MSEASDKAAEQERELRRRFASGDEKLKFQEGAVPKPDSLSPADSENEQRLGSDTADSDHVRKKLLIFPTLSPLRQELRLIEFERAIDLRNAIDSRCRNMRTAESVAAENNNI